MIEYYMHAELDVLLFKPFKPARGVSLRLPQYQNLKVILCQLID